jgi:glycosyltransferase involved in cell wall biosynthesis
VVLETAANQRERTPPILNVVVRCYNEQEVLPDTAKRLSDVIDELIAQRLVAPGTGIYFVDDGSKDRTWPIIVELNANRPDRFHGMKLSRNRGHQNALLAGLRNTPGDILITIDADLQDDIRCIEQMIRHYLDGCELVFGARSDRSSDGPFLSFCAGAFYRLLRRLGADIVPQHADFRLMSRRALDALSDYSETNLFLRAIVMQIGFKTATVTYRRAPRLAGETKYPLSRLAALAIDGVTSFLMRPLRLITITGMLVSVISFVLGFWAVGMRLFSNWVPPGWASTLVPVTLIGGLQLLCLGIIGEYVGKIYMEVKRRPHYEIEQTI